MLEVEEKIQSQSSVANLHKSKEGFAPVSPPVVSAIGATKYLAIETNKPNTDGLKTSRSTGTLWGVKAPPFLKCGRKVLYRITDLDEWLAQFQKVTNNAQVEETLDSEEEAA